MKAGYLFARKEFLDHLRNGWIAFLASAFAIFALVISLAGFGFTGTVTPMDSAASLRSLTSLVLYLIPLMGLLLGYDGIVGERERGTLDLLRTYPLSATQITLGKLAGLGGVLALTLCAGLLLPALLSLRGGSEGAWLLWSAFLGLAIWLGVIFIALALWLSTLGSERGAVLGMVLALWLVLVLLFDLGLIGLLVATEGTLPDAVLHGLLLFNPASLFRVLILGLLVGGEGIAELGFGEGGLPWPLFGMGVLLWSALPCLLAVLRLRKMQ